MAKVKLQKDKTYSASVHLSFFEALADNQMVADHLTQLGFRKVKVTGVGNLRKATGTWSKEDLTVDLPSQLSGVTVVGSATPVPKSKTKTPLDDSQAGPPR